MERKLFRHTISGHVVFGSYVIFSGVTTSTTILYRCCLQLGSAHLFRSNKHDHYNPASPSTSHCDYYIHAIRTCASDCYQHRHLHIERHSIRDLD